MKPSATSNVSTALKSATSPRRRPGCETVLMETSGRPCDAPSPASSSRPTAAVGKNRQACPAWRCLVTPLGKGTQVSPGGTGCVTGNANFLLRSPGTPEKSSLRAAAEEGFHVAPAPQLASRPCIWAENTPCLASQRLRPAHAPTSRKTAFLPHTQCEEHLTPPTSGAAAGRAGARLASLLLMQTLSQAFFFFF